MLIQGQNLGIDVVVAEDPLVATESKSSQPGVDFDRHQSRLSQPHRHQSCRPPALPAARVTAPRQCDGSRIRAVTAADRTLTQADWEQNLLHRYNIEKIFLTNDFDDRFRDLLGVRAGRDTRLEKIVGDIVEDVRRRYRAVARKAGIEHTGSSWPVA